MSTSIIKIIPMDETIVFSSNVSEQALSYVRKNIGADSIEVIVNDQISFVDCGGNLEEIICPVCGAELPFDWWGDVMDHAAASDFEDLSLNLPCCGRNSSLNNLQYNFPCGFSRWELAISNPIDEITDDFLSALEGILGKPVRKIEAHY